MQPNQPPAQPDQPPLTPPDPNQSYEPAPPAFGQPQVFMPGQPISPPPQLSQPYPLQQPAPLNPFDTPVDRSQRPPSVFEQRFQEYVVSSTNPAQTKKPRNMWPLILIIIFLILVVGGAGAYYWFFIRKAS